MSDAPTRIWAVASLGLVGTGRWVTQGAENPLGNIPYILATPEALSTASEVQALVEAARQEGVRMGMEAAAGVDLPKGRDLPYIPPNYLTDWKRGLVAGQSAMKDAIRARAADPAAVKRIAEGLE